MSKLIAFRFDPAMDLVIEEIADDLASKEIRRITKREVMERAVATLRSLIVSGSISVLQQPEIQSAYQQSLAQIRGLTIGTAKEEDKQ